jgi:hypothetical protein
MARYSHTVLQHYKKYYLEIRRKVSNDLTEHAMTTYISIYSTNINNRIPHKKKKKGKKRVIAGSTQKVQAGKRSRLIRPHPQ